MTTHVDGVPWSQVVVFMGDGKVPISRDGLLDAAHFPFNAPPEQTFENLNNHYVAETETTDKDIHLMTFVDAAGVAEALDITWSFGASHQYAGAVEWATNWIPWADANLTPIKEVRILAWRGKRWTPVDIVTLDAGGTPVVRHVGGHQLS